MELMRVREAGYAVDDEEFEEGLRCVGAPVFDHRGHVVASISTAAPVFRLKKNRVPEVARLVMAAARGLSEDLGYQNSPDAKREPVARPASGSGRLKGRRS
jgi:DNA-binding IclR family transcriptional regulator